MTKILEPIQIGSIEAKNRAFMAPMTRNRATKDHVPTPLMIEYYAQRASAGLIISETTGISREGFSWPYAPGIWNEEQVEAWKPITQAVHEKGGRIVAQLLHMGRTTHSKVTGFRPVSSSAVRFSNQISTYEGKQDSETPHALTHSDIKRVLEEYANAAKNAIAAGFDGVEIHAGHRFLIDQFLKESVNHRTDEYGGSIENRARFLEEVVATVVEEIGAERTAIRLMPEPDNPDKGDTVELFIYIAQALNRYELMFIEFREEQLFLHDLFRKYYSGVVGLNSKFTRETAIKAIESNSADFITFGRPFIANPDLIVKIQLNKPWMIHDQRTVYLQGPDGYTDYPAMQQREI